jgi:hypothetical protein
MTRSRQTADWGSRAGLAKIVPSSVAVGSGTGSADTTGTVTYSGVSSVSLNDVFSSTYKNYKVVLTPNGGVGGTNRTLYMKLRLSGTDSSSSYGQVTRNIFFSDGSEATKSNSNSTTQWDLGWMTTTNNFASTELTVINPAASIRTSLFGLGINTNSGDSTYALCQIGGAHSDNTNYDGLTIYPSTGTITGSLLVLGYN